MDVLEPFEPELRGDDIGLETRRHLDDPLGLRRHMDVHGRVERAQRMLEPRDLVGGVAE